LLVCIDMFFFFFFIEHRVNSVDVQRNKILTVCNNYHRCSFKFILKVGVEESIVNAPLVSLPSKNTNNAKSEVRFKQLIRDLWCVHNRLFNAYFEDKFKRTPDRIIKDKM
jgi:hypothetical protein